MTTTPPDDAAPDDAVPDRTAPHPASFSTAAQPRRRPAGRGSGPRQKVDHDIRHHPEYKMPWWRKPLKPWMFWVVVGVMAAIVVAAIIVSLSLGIRLF